jgi:hypothetical protein
MPAFDSMVCRLDADPTGISSLATYSSALDLRIKQKCKCIMHAHVILYALLLDDDFEIDALSKNTVCSYECPL